MSRIRIRLLWWVIRIRQQFWSEMTNIFLFFKAGILDRESAFEAEKMIMDNAKLKRMSIVRIKKGATMAPDFSRKAGVPPMRQHKFGICDFWITNTDLEQ